MPPSPSVCLALEQNPLFAGIPAEETGYVVCQFEKGGRIMNSCRGEQAIGVVVQGVVEVYSLCIDGTSVNLTTHKAGDCFGIATIFTEEDLTTVLHCARRATVAYITRSRFMALLALYPDLFTRYGRLCNQKITFLTRKIEFLTMPSCRARLSSYLLQNRDVQNNVHLGVSKEQLARIIGVGRSSLFRELGNLREEGIITIAGRTIQIKRPESLLTQISNSASALPDK